LPQFYLSIDCTFVRIVQHRRDHGSYKPQTQDRGVQRPRRGRSEEDILSSVEDQPGTSFTKLARQHNIAHSTIW
jgi:hypothetical protein